NRVEALYVRAQSKVRQEQQQKGDQRITVCVRAQLPRIVGQVHQRGEYLQVVPVDRGPHRSTCGCIVFEVGCGRQSTVTWVIVEVPDPGPDEFVQSPEKIGAHRQPRHLGLHGRPDAKTGQLGQVSVHVGLVGEVLKKAAL